MKIKIFVASTSKHKLSAVKRAATEVLGEKGVEVEGVKVPSGVNEQPVGWREIIKGAKNRLDSLKREIKKEGKPYEYLVAIENGIIFIQTKEEEKWFDVGAVLVEDVKGKQQLSFTGFVEMPKALVDKAKQLGFETTTVGSLIAQKYGGEGTDPHSILTRNAVSRRELLTSAVKVAFGQLLFGKSQ